MATWRPLLLSDIEKLVRVAAEVHPELPESHQVFAERLALFPEGCLALVEDDSFCGYAISHPIRQCQLPELDCMLGEVDPGADQYYIHDIAILPALRGRGLASVGVQKLLAIADRYPSTCLVSVYGTERFWGSFGFIKCPTSSALRTKLLSFGESATFLQRSNNSEGVHSRG
jgi:ribosomal protein S18 acetylase RimI-like enzyme